MAEQHRDSYEEADRNTCLRELEKSVKNNKSNKAKKGQKKGAVGKGDR